MRKLLVKNSLSGVALSLINVMMLLIVIPIFISNLGLELYGVFALMMVIGNLNVFANLGLTNALIKFLAEQGKTRESDLDIAISVVILMVFLMPLVIVGLYFNQYVILTVLNVPSGYYDDAKWLYIYLVISNVLLILGQIPRAILDSAHKIVLTNILQLVYSFMYWGLILIMVVFGYKLAEVGLAALLAASIWFLAVIYKACMFWGRLELNGVIDDFIRIARKQLSYGSKICVGGMFGFFFEPLSKILVSNYFGMTEVAYLDIALRIKGQLYSIFGKLFYPLYPLISSMNDGKKIKLLVTDVEQKTLVFVVPLICMAIFLTPPTLKLWLGFSDDIISNSTVIILCSFLLSVTVIPCYQFLMSKGHADKTLLIQLSLVLTNIVVFFIFKDVFLFYAVVVSNASAILVASLITLYFQNKYLSSLIFSDWMQVWKIFLIAAINISVGAILNSFVYDDWAKIFTISFTLTVISWLLIRRLNLITQVDVLRYVGKNERLKSFGLRVFVRKTHRSCVVGEPKI